jgi:transcription factor IIIB subunit 2
VTEDEFADDPEVMHCLLDALEARIKAQIWTNENEDWMREKQNKEHKKKLAAKGPPKKTRNRTRVPRIGEGQASPASSAGEAAVAQLKMRAISKRLNQNAISALFEKTEEYHRTSSIYGGSSTVGTGSVAASREASVAPSEACSEITSQVEESNTATNLEALPRDTNNAKNKENNPPQAVGQVLAAASQGGQEDVEEEEEIDYDQMVYENEQDDYPEEIDPFADTNGGFDEDDWE